jgi:hypothetical protein
MALITQKYISLRPQGGLLQITASDELVVEHFDSRGKMVYQAKRQ